MLVGNGSAAAAAAAAAAAISAGVLGTIGSSFSSPPIIMAAATEELHMTIIPTPATAIAAII
jgi:hypothetical protein